MIELPTIIVNGQVRTLRRWGLSDVFKLQRVLNDFSTGATLRGISLDFSKDVTPESLMGFVAAGLAFSEGTLTDWIYSWYDPVISKDEEIHLPELVKTIELLLDHPDIVSFLENVGDLISSLGKER